MTARALPEDALPTAPVRDTGSLRGALLDKYTLRFAGGPVDIAVMRASHNGPTPTTMSNTKLTRPAETYPGEAERMIDTWTRGAQAAIQRARDATTGPRLVSELEDAVYSIQEALRWAKP